MISIKNLKIFTYIILLLVIIISFILTNIFLNFIIAGKLSAYNIIYVILNLILNFTMFFIVFRYSQQLIEKETNLKEIMQNRQTSDEILKIETEPEEQKELNVDEIIKQIIPQSPQNLTLENFSEKILANIAKVSELVQGVFYVKNKTDGQFHPIGKYAFYSNQPPDSFIEGETLPGQAAKDKKILNINNVPEDYFTIASGLGKSSPNNLLIFPIPDKEEIIAVAELATFKAYDKDFEKLFEKLAVLLGKIIVKIK